MQIDWDESEEHYHAWEAGKTGHPWIDAIMRQLNEIGWMHHLVQHNVHSMSTFLICCVSSVQSIDGCLQSCDGDLQARHSVACFLTRGDLYISWERGRDTFDRYAVSHRVCTWWLQHHLAVEVPLAEVFPISRSIRCCGHEGCSLTAIISSTMGTGCG